MAKMGMGDTLFESSETDEEFLAKYIADISSASSSISWAEDAVEAEMTKKIFCLWEDIQRVCVNEILEKPKDMTTQVYEECLSWRRAFPLQDLAKYSRYTEDDITPTQTPTKDTSLLLLRSSPYASCSPESPTSSCVTPNPDKNASYVALWLSDCQNQTSEIKEMDIADDMGSLSLFRAKKNDSANTVATDIPYYPPPSTATRNMSMIRSLESIKPDPNNFFTSLALNNVVSSVDRLDGGGESNNNCSSKVIRVQRPISSNAKGHLITPLRTNYSHPSVSRSFRETGSNSNYSFRFTDDYNSRRPTRSIVTVPSRTAPALPVCPPPIIIPPEERSAGPRRTHSKTSNTTPTFAPNQPGLNTLQYSRSVYVDRESSSKLSPSRTPISGTFQPNSSFNCSSRATENDYIRVAKATTWSRHSSTSESYRFSVTNTEEQSKKGGVMDTCYFETISENYNTQSSVKVSRPDYLPVSEETELNPSSSKPVRPFLYWLLDKVSPS